MRVRMRVRDRLVYAARGRNRLDVRRERRDVALIQYRVDQLQCRGTSLKGGKGSEGKEGRRREEM